MGRELIEKSVLQRCILSSFHITEIDNSIILHEEFFFKSEKLAGHRIGTCWGKLIKQERERDLLGALRWEVGERGRKNLSLSRSVSGHSFSLDISFEKVLRTWILN